MSALYNLVWPHKCWHTSIRCNKIILGSFWLLLIKSLKLWALLHLSLKLKRTGCSSTWALSKIMSLWDKLPLISLCYLNCTMLLKHHFRSFSIEAIFMLQTVSAIGTQNICGMNHVESKNQVCCHNYWRQSPINVSVLTVVWYSQ